MFQNEHIWRTLANVWTFLLAAFLVVNFFSFNKYGYFTAVFSVIYAAILGIYATAKELKRWRSSYEGRHSGAWFVIGWTALMVLLVSAKLVLDEKYTVPPEAVADYIIVFSLFALTRKSKRMHAKKKKRATNEIDRNTKLLPSLKKFFGGMREKLSHHPTVYAILGAVGIILFWRGIWHSADFIAVFFLNNYGEAGINYAELLDSVVSTTIGFVLLLFTGLFVSDFIGSQIISTAEKEEREIEKIAKKTEREEKTETERLDEIENKFEEVTNHLDEHLEKLEKRFKKKRSSRG